MMNERYKGAYHAVLVESFRPTSTSGKHGEIHVRPLSGQGYPTTLFVSCSKKHTDESLYRVGTKFVLIGRLTSRKNEGEYLYANYRDDVKTLTDDEASRFLADLPDSNE
jgi:hypothetical protein